MKDNEKEKEKKERKENLRVLHRLGWTAKARHLLGQHGHLGPSLGGWSGWGLEVGEGGEGELGEHHLLGEELLGRHAELGRLLRRDLQ